MIPHSTLTATASPSFHVEHSAHFIQLQGIEKQTKAFLDKIFPLRNNSNSLELKLQDMSEKIPVASVFSWQKNTSIKPSPAPVGFRQQEGKQSTITLNNRIYQVTQKTDPQSGIKMSRIQLGQCRCFVPGDIDTLKSMVHSGSKIIVNAHGLNESGSFYDASAFRDDGVQKFRTFSRADAQMGNGQIPFIVSFKQPNEQGHILTDHGVSDPIIQSVHQIIQFFKDIGSPLGKNQIILSGKSRGAYGTITAAAVVLSQPEVAATICLESPILDWAHSATALGSGSLSKQGFAASRLILEKILKSNLLHNSEILSYDMQKGLENLKNRLHSLGRSEVNIKIIKFINDATVGDNVTNQAQQFPLADRVETTSSSLFQRQKETMTY